MKVNEFQQLSESEVQLMLEAPALITVLIATADGEIDAKEINWGHKVVEYRDHVGDEHLFAYYQAVETAYDAQVKAIMEEKHVGNQEFIASLTERLEQTSPILKKINQLYAERLYKSWKSFAVQVAKSSGGFVGFGSISAQEKQLMDLHMIQF